ncbi:hypothetical protein QUA35_25760, partial [Microcoleus sp. N9_B2]|uniref:hypothetical protein n=1 Tax=unclassified Microcoleus TaxID=2642155 RepID=UPI002FD66031
MLNKNKINSARVAVNQTVHINLITNLLHRKSYLVFIKINTGCGKLSGFSPERETARGLQS